MTDSSTFIELTSLLDPNGPIAIIIKQELAPDDEDERIVFPPTYPLTTFKGRVQRFEHGEYRVAIELPPDTKRDKDEKKDNQKPGYQIDRFPDGTNICEIDSIQSQANRIEPQFKTIKDGKLVPQITIEVGNQIVNLLDAGHRAADAVVRMSTLAHDFHAAWLAAKEGDLFGLATLAPTTIVFGAWDSRSTQAKLQRLIKAHIRATNVLERTRSAQYTPAADYVGIGAIDQSVSSGEDEKNNLSQEGMLHALSTQTAGGVVLTASSILTRTVTVNLAAIRQLRADGVRPAHAEKPTDEEMKEYIKEEERSAIERTRVLQEYILGLTLLAAYSHPSLNLREGCNLQCKGDTMTRLIQDRRNHAVTFDESKIEAFADCAAKAFFAAASRHYDDKNRRGLFERGVAEQFLSLSKADRDKVRAIGAVTAKTLKKFSEVRKDPFKAVADEIKNVKSAIGGAPAKTKPRVKNAEAFVELAKLLKELSESESIDGHARVIAKKLSEKAAEHDDSRAALKEIQSEIREFKNAKKRGDTTADTDDETEDSQ